MKIVALAGGLSLERNISLSAGTTVTEVLRVLGRQVSLIGLYFSLETSGTDEAFFNMLVSEIYKKVSREASGLDQVRRGQRGDSPSMFGLGALELCRMADMVFLALHGTCSEDGRVQAAFDLIGIPYTGAGYLGSVVAMDKDLTKRMVADVVSTPDRKTVTYIAADIDRLVEAARLPLVVKSVASDSFTDVSIAYTVEELRWFFTEGLALGGCAVLEKYIRGWEIQVGILEDKALPSTEIAPKQDFYDYANKYQSGITLEVCPAEITPEEEACVWAVAPWVYETLGLSAYPRTNFILTGDGEPWFLEISTLPGMISTSLLSQKATTAGIDYNELYQRIVHASLET